MRPPARFVKKKTRSRRLCARAGRGLLDVGQARAAVEHRLRHSERAISRGERERDSPCSSSSRARERARQTQAARGGLVGEDDFGVVDRLTSRRQALARVRFVRPSYNSRSRVSSLIWLRRRVRTPLERVVSREAFHRTLSIVHSRASYTQSTTTLCVKNQRNLNRKNLVVGRRRHAAPCSEPSRAHSSTDSSVKSSRKRLIPTKSMSERYTFRCTF